MDRDQPKTRQERKGGKYKPVFNAKTVRAKEALVARHTGLTQSTAVSKKK
jgi:hypothetical protein